MIQHPNVHRAAADWSEEQTLHVASCYSNPFRWRTRRELAQDFRRHMAQSPNVKLHFIELAYGDRPWDVTGDHEGDVQVRAAEELFHKENLLNLAIARFPPDWRYGAIIDADFHFTRHDWALEAIHQLQMYEWVQLFSSYADLSGRELGQGHRVIQTNKSFVATYHEHGFRLPTGYTPSGWKLPAPAALSYERAMGYERAMMARPPGYVPVGATGGAWAFRRRSFDEVGGLLDRCILGHGDWFMAFGLIGEPARDMHFAGYSEDYQRYILAWQERAASFRKNVGFVDCHATHGFHGPKTSRGYSHRDEILVRNGYTPTRDVFPNAQGVLQLARDKPALRDEIRRYFLSRSEDMPHIP